MTNISIDKRCSLLTYQLSDFSLRVQVACSTPTWKDGLRHALSQTGRREQAIDDTLCNESIYLPITHACACI